MNATDVRQPIGVCVVQSPDTLVIMLRYGEIVSLYLPFMSQNAILDDIKPVEEEETSRSDVSKLKV